MTRGTDAQSYFTEAALFDKNRIRFNILLTRG